MVSVRLFSEKLGNRSLVAPTSGVNQGQGAASQTSPVTPITVTLERQPGTPADEVARAIGVRLGWPVYDRELLEEVSRQLNVPVKQLEDLDERGQSWLMEVIRGFGQEAGVTEYAFFHRLVGAIRSAVARGSCVIVGHGAGLILPSSTNLRVRLVGALEDRIANVSRTLHLSHDEAARKIQETVSNRVRFLKEHVLDDPTTLDRCALVLNTSYWSPAACADLVLEALRHKFPGQVRSTGSAASWPV